MSVPTSVGRMPPYDDGPSRVTRVGLLLARTHAPCRNTNTHTQRRVQNSAVRPRSYRREGLGKWMHVEPLASFMTNSQWSASSIRPSPQLLHGGVYRRRPGVAPRRRAAPRAASRLRRDLDVLVLLVEGGLDGGRDHVPLLLLLLLLLHDALKLGLGRRRLVLGALGLRAANVLHLRERGELLLKLEGLVPLDRGLGRHLVRGRVVGRRDRAPGAGGPAGGGALEGLGGDGGLDLLLDLPLHEQGDLALEVRRRPAGDVGARRGDLRLGRLDLGLGRRELSLQPHNLRVRRDRHLAVRHKRHGDRLLLLVLRLVLLLLLVLRLGLEADGRGLTDEFL